MLFFPERGLNLNRLPRIRRLQFNPYRDELSEILTVFQAASTADMERLRNPNVMIDDPKDGPPPVFQVKLKKFRLKLKSPDSNLTWRCA